MWAWGGEGTQPLMGLFVDRGIWCSARSVRGILDCFFSWPAKPGHRSYSCDRHLFLAFYVHWLQATWWIAKTLTLKPLF